MIRWVLGLISKESVLITAIALHKVVILARLTYASIIIACERKNSVWMTVSIAAIILFALIPNLDTHVGIYGAG